jgi:uncharacterized membrane protein YecN with MAPEG domain
MADFFLLPSDYGYPMLSSLGVIFACFATGTTVGAKRQQIFPLDFMKEHFGHHHKEAMGQDIISGGFPDCGEGLYSDKLSYKDWFQYASTQRSHMNFVENLVILVSVILFAGLSYPVEAGIAGLAILIGRVLYIIGYRASGPAGRQVGNMIGTLGYFAAIVLSVLSGLDNGSYGVVVLAALANALLCYSTGMSIVGLRFRTFTKDYMESNFGAVHKEAFGSNVSNIGFPDTGNARYSEKLSYKEWYTFACAQRAHMNYVESIGIIIPLILIAGIAMPEIGALVGFGYFAGRLIYAIGYRTNGPKGRIIGATILDITLLGLIVLAVISGLKALNNTLSLE